MTYRLCKCLETLRSELNQIAPNRSKVSDGWIGDASHASRSSDHNPWIHLNEGGHEVGIVSAIDVTNDPNGGMGGQQLADALQISRDARIKYVIWNKHIMAGGGGPNPWVWRDYHGLNAHQHHVHISVADVVTLFDSTTPWGLKFHTSLNPTQSVPSQLNLNLQQEPVLRAGASGSDVLRLQKALNKLGYGIPEDYQFGPKTDSAVRTFQKTEGLVADGVVGPYTWEKLNGPKSLA